MFCSSVEHASSHTTKQVKKNDARRIRNESAADYDKSLLYQKEKQFCSLYYN